MLSIVNLSYRTVKALRGCCLALAILVLLLLIAGCVSLVFMAGRATAAPPVGSDIMMVVDQSRSLWELGGIGSDPDMLRVDAARLFINTLGVDQDLTYRLGIIVFGTDARLIAPLTPLADTDQRRRLLEAVVDPQPMGWTDVNEALALADEQLFSGDQPAPDRQPTIILMTDGRPETETTNTEQARQAYLNALEAKVRQFAERGGVFHTVLLSNRATDADSELQTVYRPLWTRLSREFDHVHFHEARTAADLPAIYHAIAVDLQGAQTAGPVVERDVVGPVEEEIEVEPGLYRVTFVIRKSQPDLRVGIVRPNDTSLRVPAAGVRFAGDRLQEVWSIRNPEPGTWRIVLDGRGGVTVWKDYVPAPTSTPTFTPTPTPTNEPTNTPTHRPTNTPTPTSTPNAFAGQQITTPEADGTHRPDEPAPTSGIGAAIAGLVGIVVLGLLATVVGSVRSLRGPKRPAPVEGRLHLVQTPEGERPGQRWELGPRNRKRVTIGGAGSDIQLTSADHVPARAAEIIGRQNGKHDIEILLRPLGTDGTCRINDRPVLREQPLWDRDRIQIGDYVLRYENLSRRRPVRRSRGAGVRGSWGAGVRGCGGAGGRRGGGAGARRSRGAEERRCGGVRGDGIEHR